MSAEVQNTKSKSPEAPAPETVKEILAQQQENDQSEDEEFLSDSAEVVDSNDATAMAAVQESLDLDFAREGQKMWLVRIPRFLAEHWRDRESLRGQELGKIFIAKDATLRGRSQSMKLRLHETDERLKDLPHQYNLQILRENVKNQYIFTEQNLQKFTDDTVPKVEPKTENQPVIPNSATGQASGVNGAAPANGATSVMEKPFAELSMEERDKIRRIRWLQRKRRRFNKFKNQDGTEKVLPFVKTIPKKTAMVGTVMHEAQAVPDLRDPNYSKIISARKKLVKEEPRPSVTLLQEHSGVSLSTAGLSLKTDTSSFLKQSTEKKKTDGRSIRMPQKDLIDLLFKLFDQFDYWSLKGLKERTKQPEVYLKETLDQVAILIKKGPYALKWALKKEFKELKDQQRQERLGDLAQDNEEEDEDDNEEDVEMEDVVDDVEEDVY